MGIKWLMAAIAYLTLVLPYISGEEESKTLVLRARLKAELYALLADDEVVTEAWCNAVADADEHDTVVYIDDVETDVEFETIEL